MQTRRASVLEAAAAESTKHESQAAAHAPRAAALQHSNKASIQDVLTRAYLKKFTSRKERHSLVAAALLRTRNTAPLHAPAPATEAWGTSPARGSQRLDLANISQQLLQAHASTGADAKRRWRRDREQVEAVVVRFNALAAACGMVSVASTIVQNEMCFAGLDPRSLAVDVAKCVTSASSLACIFCVYRIHSTSILAARLFQHLRRGRTFDDHIPLTAVAARPLFWVEVGVCGVHCPPFVTGEVSMEFLSNVIVYRLETLASLFAFLRLYLCWRTAVDKFVAEMPDSKVSISTYNGVRFDSRFFLKKMLNSWTAIKFIFGVWACVLVLCGYLFRSTEATSCLFHYTQHPDCHLRSAKVWVLNGIEFEKVFAT